MQQGRRTDMEAVLVSADRRLGRDLEAGTGLTELELFERHGSQMLRYGKAVRRFRELTVPARNWPMEVIVCVGPTGCGKTKGAYDRWPDLFSLSEAKGSGTYWDGYDGQETVLVDEMDGGRFKWSFLLRLTDRTPLDVPVHGGAVAFGARRIVFCSNEPVERWYPQKSERYPWGQIPCANPFERRITLIEDYYSHPQGGICQDGPQLPQQAPQAPRLLALADLAPSPSPPPRKRLRDDLPSRDDYDDEYQRAVIDQDGIDHELWLVNNGYMMPGEDSHGFHRD